MLLEILILAAEATPAATPWLAPLVTGLVSAILGGGLSGAVVQVIANRRINEATAEFKKSEINEKNLKSLGIIIDEQAEQLTGYKTEMREMKEELKATNADLRKAKLEIDQLQRAPVAPSNIERMTYEARIEELREVNDMLLDRLLNQDKK